MGIYKLSLTNVSLASSVKQNYSLPMLTRYYNFFGRDYTNSYNNHPGIYFDDIRFYNISLTPKQIQNIMKLFKGITNYKSI